ncbi:MAG: hypothetical protein Q6K80_08335 [Thermostichus sp. DG_1_6_bins_120]
MTLLSTAWAAPLALLALGSPWARWLDGLMSIPFLTPPFWVSLDWTLAVGRRGYLSSWGLPGSAAEGILWGIGPTHVAQPCTNDIPCSAGSNEQIVKLQILLQQR